MLFKKVLFLLLISFLAFSIYADDIQDYVGTDISICIIYFPSNYKKKLSSKLEKELKNKGFKVTKDTFKNIKDYDPDDYDVVILLSGIATFTPYPQATLYIKNNDYKENIIYFCAAYMTDTIYGLLDRKKVDALTAASKMENLNDTTDMILQKVNEVLVVGIKKNH